MLLTVQARISFVVSALNLLVIPDLVSAPDIISSSTAFSWPHGTEFVDSCLKLFVFSQQLVLTQIFGIFLRMFRSLYCSDWQILIIASL